MTKITKKQAALLNAIYYCEMHDGQDPVGHSMWVSVVCAGFGRSAGGIMAALVRKDLVTTNGEVVAITQKGADAIGAKDAEARGEQEAEDQVDDMTSEAERLDLAARFRRLADSERNLMVNDLDELRDVAQTDLGWCTAEKLSWSDNLFKASGRNWVFCAVANRLEQSDIQQTKEWLQHEIIWAAREGYKSLGGADGLVKDAKLMAFAEALEKLNDR